MEFIRTIKDGSYAVPPSGDRIVRVREDTRTHYYLSGTSESLNLIESDLRTMFCECGHLTRSGHFDYTAHGMDFDNEFNEPCICGCTDTKEGEADDS